MTTFRCSRFREELSPEKQARYLDCNWIALRAAYAAERAQEAL